MIRKKLSRQFFNRPTLQVAKELLGKFLVYKINEEIIAAMITETEAYIGPRDLASHASHGKTPRTEVMFGPPGHAYIYLIYGMYHCFNIVTERDGYPAAVLIRGACPVRGRSPLGGRSRAEGVAASNGINGPARLNFSTNTLDASAKGLSKNLGGPGKLCRYFQIDKSLNNEDLTMSKKLWIEDRGIKIKPGQIKRGKRISIDYAGPYKHKLWRFFIKSAT